MLAPPGIHRGQPSSVLPLRRPPQVEKSKHLLLKTDALTGPHGQESIRPIPAERCAVIRVRRALCPSRLSKGWAAAEASRAASRWSPPGSAGWGDIVGDKRPHPKCLPRTTWAARKPLFLKEHKPTSSPLPDQIVLFLRCTYPSHTIWGDCTASLSPVSCKLYFTS